MSAIDKIAHSPMRVKSLTLLSQLWLHEPDAETIARAVQALGLPPAEPAELATAYADVFLLNVYPYSTAFTDDHGELNRPEAQRVAALYEAHGYYPPEFGQVGAPDHLGLCLGFLAHLGEKRLESRDSLGGFVEWGPICCLAVEREPSVHSFYGALAMRTREALLETAKVIPPNLQSPISNLHLPLARYPSDEELTLRDLLRFFLAPAQCGVFLSRSRLGQMAKTMGMRLPFGSRFEVAEILFASAGEGEKVGELLTALEAEVKAWAQAYRGWAETYPGWRLIAEVWLSRTDTALQTLTGLRQTVEAETA